ncbi:MAG: hypothetical protein ACYTBS_07795 [Planctomycetota bacterium]|jgi:hypothetical protein
MDNVTTLFPRGKTYFDGATPPTTFAQTIDLEGQLRRSDDMDPSNPRQRRSGRQCVCRAVRNVSGITLATKRVVKWATGFVGRRVDGYASTFYGNDAAGIVDDHLSGGIPANDIGWLVVSGPCLGITGYATVAQAELQDVVVAAGSSSQATSAGKLQGVAVTTNATYGHSAVNAIAKALTARTTANTDTETLYEVTILKGA